MKNNFMTEFDNKTRDGRLSHFFLFEILTKKKEYTNGSSKKKTEKPRVSSVF